MAWITPVTDRTSGSAMMTAEDMNRITGDVKYLEEELTGSSTISKTSWTNSDFIYASFWHEMLGIIEDLLDLAGITGEVMTDLMTYDNINAVETNLQKLYGSEIPDLTDFTAYGTSIAEDGGDVNLNDHTTLENETISNIMIVLS